VSAKAEGVYNGRKPSIDVGKVKALAGEGLSLPLRPPPLVERFLRLVRARSRVRGRRLTITGPTDSETLFKLRDDAAFLVFVHVAPPFPPTAPPCPRPPDYRRHARPQFETVLTGADADLQRMKAKVRGAVIQAHQYLRAGEWTEADDHILDTVTMWLISVANRGRERQNRAVVEAEKGITVINRIGSPAR
jgi:hypothetical protein